MGTYDDDVGFARWVLVRDKFTWHSSFRVANYLVARSTMTGMDDVIHQVDVGETGMSPLLASDLFDLLRLAEPEAWREYCADAEKYWEDMERIKSGKNRR